MKVRLDKALVERNLAATRMRAQERIASGLVTVDGTIVTKPSFPVEPDRIVEIHGDSPPYASRGGFKLAAALDTWNIAISGRICLDIGISTGGFSDCLLQRGAACVIGVDSGHSQLASSLQSHPRLCLLEKTNARFLTAAMLSPGISFFAVDVSFIAASLLLPAVIAAAFPARTESQGACQREAVVLVKPQFEAGREYVGKNGVVRNIDAYGVAIHKVRQTVITHGATETAVIDSPIAGKEGNREFLLYARF